MRIPLTPVLTLLYLAIIEVNLQCFSESVSLRDIGKPTSRAELISLCSLYFKAVNGVHLGSALKLTSPFSRKIIYYENRKNCDDLVSKLTAGINFEDQWLQL